jgi:hypothetical protein
MIRFVKISKNELQELVELAYKGDQELLDKYHVGKFTLFEAVSSTMGMINEMSEQQKLTYYKVLWQKKAIGYVVVFQDFLYSFGVNIKFRIAEILTSWWNEIMKVLGGRFICMLFKNNTRAIEYLERRGMRILDEKEHSITLVKF